MTPEKNLKQRVRKHLRFLGAVTYAPVPTGYGEDCLDIIACLRGRYLEIEAKTAPKKPTPRQKLRGEKVEQAGGVSFWFDSFEGYLANMVLKGLISPASK